MSIKVNHNDGFVNHRKLWRSFLARLPLHRHSSGSAPSALRLIPAAPALLPLFRPRQK